MTLSIVTPRTDLSYLFFYYGPSKDDFSVWIGQKVTLVEGLSFCRGSNLDDLVELFYIYVEIGHYTVTISVRDRKTLFYTGLRKG